MSWIINLKTYLPTFTHSLSSPVINSIVLVLDSG